MSYIQSNLLNPYRTASKPYQYAAPILMFVSLIECLLVATQRPMGPGSLLSIWIHAIMLVVVGYFAYLSWRQGDLSKEEVKSNRAVRFFSLIMLFLPVMLDSVLDVWSDFM